MNLCLQYRLLKNLSRREQQTIKIVTGGPRVKYPHHVYVDRKCIIKNQDIAVLLKSIVVLCFADFGYFRSSRLVANVFDLEILTWEFFFFFFFSCCCCYQLRGEI